MTVTNDACGRSLPGAIFLLGMPRSGTTWIGTIFDACDDTLVRHEPDTIHASNSFPFVPTPGDYESYLDSARGYLLSRCHDRELRCVLGGDGFKKNYRGAGRSVLRHILVRGSRALDAVSRGRLERSLCIPDLIEPGKPVVPVVKSVDSTARTPLFANACPEYPFVFIIRHPCGVVDSKLRGTRLGKLGKGRAFRDWLLFPLATELGLTEAVMDGWDDLEVAAWGWTLTNDAVLRGTAGLNNVTLLAYDRFCDEPLSRGREIIEAVGLPWSEQIEQYLRHCVALNANRSAGYYSTSQNPLQAANKWQSSLRKEDIQRIMAISSQSNYCREFISSSLATEPVVAEVQG